MLAFAEVCLAVVMKYCTWVYITLACSCPMCAHKTNLNMCHVFYFGIHGTPEHRVYSKKFS